MAGNGGSLNDVTNKKRLALMSLYVVKTANTLMSENQGQFFHEAVGGPLDPGQVLLGYRAVVNQGEKIAQALQLLFDAGMDLFTGKAFVHVADKPLARTYPNLYGPLRGAHSYLQCPSEPLRM
jgi:hypothetical protein